MYSFESCLLIPRSEGFPGFDDSNWIKTQAVDEQAVMEGNKKASEAEGVKFTGRKDGFAVFEVKSGNYHFTSLRISGLNHQ